MQWEEMDINSAHCILQLITPTMQVADCSRKKATVPWANTAWHKRCLNLCLRLENMKKYLLLPLVALGLIAWTPAPAKAAVHFSFGFGVPGYYGYYGPYYGYDPGYSYNYRPYPYWYHGHRYYHHYWRRR
jgi:hypothetical protein